MEEKLDEQVAAQQPEKFPTVAEIEAQIETRNYPARRRQPVRRPGAATSRSSSRCRRSRRSRTSSELRFAPANHVLQSATRALKTGMSEEIILACLLHDCVLS